VRNIILRLSARVSPWDYWLEAVYYVIRTAPLLGPSLSPFFALHGQQPRKSCLLFEPSDYDFCRKIHIFRENTLSIAKLFVLFFYVKNLVHSQM
jgi:hypothetical protein